MIVQYCKSGLEDLAAVQWLVVRVQCNHRPKGATRTEVIQPATLRQVGVMVQPKLCAEAKADSTEH